MPITPNAAYNTNYTYDAGVAPSVIKFYERNFMKEVMPELIHNRDAQKRSLPLNNGKTIKSTSKSSGITHFVSWFSAYPLIQIRLAYKIY